ncbi:general secretion pathway protein GspB [Vibrio tapetis subsp. quintayensis]|uniref:general secretion pathway protein GspB n=1 Tax=Vibrio tapetis TaxID=52443 RepID=UPI0025B44488|nr:general secretion pathway protein GspB [Vibrio tapetis]MDN3681586.1 general secretion pathway protein GspB [Vibrio tapetis subsp. quintayensis]
MSLSIKQAAIVLLPSVIAVAIGYTQYQPVQPQPPVLIESSELAPISLIKVMPYPEFDNLTLIARKPNYIGANAVAVATPVSFVNGELVDSKAMDESLVSRESSKPVPAKSTSQADDGVEFEELDLSSLSPELAKQIQDAFASTDALNSNDTYSEREETPKISLPDESARFTGKLPAMNLQTHMFASNQQSRWIKVNGKEVYEGEWITPQVQLVTINPRNVVIRYEGEQIEMPALYEWRG